MRFLVDAQLPKRLARWLTARGHDALHTLDLAGGNRTPDAAVTEFACREERIVVTKDADFVNSHLLVGRPPRLLLITTGNMGNGDFERLLEGNIQAVETALESHCFIELNRDLLIIHE